MECSHARLPLILKPMISLDTTILSEFTVKYQDTGMVHSCMVITIHIATLSVMISCSILPRAVGCLKHLIDEYLITELVHNMQSING